jgi:hypothetical protein
MSNRVLLYVGAGLAAGYLLPKLLEQSKTPQAGGGGGGAAPAASKPASSQPAWVDTAITTGGQIVTGLIAMFKPDGTGGGAASALKSSPTTSSVPGASLVTYEV